MKTRTQSRTAKTLKLTLLVAMGCVILLMAYGNVCRRPIRSSRESVLKKDLMTMRMTIDNYTLERQRPPESLQALVTEKYLEGIPVDPVTHKTDWVLHYVTLDVAGTGPTVGIDDVHAGTDETSSDGTPFSAW